MKFEKTMPSVKLKSVLSFDIVWIEGKMYSILYKKRKEKIQVKVFFWAADLLGLKQEMFLTVRFYLYFKNIDKKLVNHPPGLSFLKVLWSSKKKGQSQKPKEAVIKSGISSADLWKSF